MLQVRDEVPGRAPWIVLGLAAANLVVFAGELWITAGPDGDARALELFETWGLVPRKLLRGAEAAVWLTPLSAMFLHVDALHLLGNLACLAVFGSPMEALFGRWRFLVLYLACGLAAAAAQVASVPSSWDASIGASGPVAGVLGAYAVSVPLGRLRLARPRVELPALVFLVGWIAIQLHSGVGGEVTGVAWAAHLGGFASGVGLGWAMWVTKPTHSDLRI